MTLDSADQPHLVYLQYLSQTSSELRYRNPVSGVSEQIASTSPNPTGLFNFTIDIEINPATGQPVTTYRNGLNPQLLAERQPDGTWSKTPLNFLDPLTKIFDLEFSGGDLHLLALDVGVSPEKLVYARRSNGSWSDETVATTVIEEWADMAIDSSGTVMVVYGKDEATVAPLFGARRTGPGSWSTKRILEVGLGRSSKLYADVDTPSTGSFEVGLNYYDPNDPSREEFYHFAIASFNKGSWTHSVVDDQRGTGSQPDIEFDSTGKLFGHYKQFQTHQIGTFRNGTWEHSVVSSDSGPYPYVSSKLEIDSAGTPVVAYEESSANDIILYR
jgi:hypothetical protein